MATLKGTAGNDTLTGTAASDSFNLIQGGEDTATGLGGNDTFSLGSTLDAGDKIDGGDGSDVLLLRGDYSAGVTFNATTIANIERIALGAGDDYSLTTNDATVAAGAAMSVDASGLGTTNSLTFDGSAETDGKFDLVGGAGDDVLKGGAGGDTFDMRKGGGEDTITGGSGNDLLLTGTNLDAGDRIDGGGGTNNVVRFTSDYSAGLTFGPDTLKNIQTLQFDNFNYKIVIDAATFAAGTAATVSGSGLNSSHVLNFDASASSANIKFVGGGGNDILTGGAGIDNFDLSHGGSDTVQGGGGNDLITMGGTLTPADHLDGGAGSDRVELTGTLTMTFGVTTMVNVETLVLDAGSNYTMTTNDATVAAGQTLLVRGDLLGAGNALVFNGQAETDGHFTLRGGAGNDTLIGGAQSDSINITTGGNDIARGSGGDDSINAGAAFTAADTINGGAGNDTLTLNGDYSAGVVFSATTVTTVETIGLTAGHSYNFTTNDATVAAGQVLTVDGSTLGGGDVLIVDAAAETDGSFDLKGGAGDDTFTLGKAGVLTASQIDGGAGSDTLVLNGDFSGGTTLGAATLAHIETLQFAAGHSYNLTANDANVAVGQTLTVDASALGASDVLIFNGAAENDGIFAFKDGAGNDALTGGANADSFDLSHGGNDTAAGGGGNDTFALGAAFTAADSIDGGSGNDTVTLNGDYSSVTFLGSSSLMNVETLQLAAGRSYNFTTNDGNVAAGQTLTVDASALSAANSLTFNGSAETDGSFDIIAGAGNDALAGGNAGNIFDLTHGGADVANGGAGNNIFNLGATFDANDRINGALGGNNTLILNGPYLGLNVTNSMVANVQTVDMQGTNTDSITWQQQAFAPLTVDASAAGGSLTFDFSAVNDPLHFIGGALTTRITGGAANDIFDAGSGTDTFFGNAGNDTFNFGANLTAADQITGGTGADMLTLNGDYSGGLTFSATTVASIGTISFAAGHDYVLTTNAATVASGAVMSVDASALGAGNHLTFNGAAETNGTFTFIDGAGNDTLTGSSGADTFTMQNGGSDTAHGGGGNDTFSFGAALDASDTIDGGTGSDTLALNGDYSGGLTLGATTMTSVETLQFAAGHNYVLATDDANVASGQSLTVDASALGAGDTLTFNGAAESDGAFAFLGGAGNDTLTGGANADTFALSSGGNDTAHGGGGNDSFTLGASLTAADSIDGGAGDDTVSLAGDYSVGLTLGAATLANVETLQLAAGHSYNLTTNDGNVAAGQVLTVDGSALGASDVLTFNGAAESDGAFSLLAGAGNDTLTGGANADTFALSTGGNDTVQGGGGNDTFTFGASLTAADTVDGGAGSDTVVLNGDYSSGLTLGAATLANVETLSLAEAGAAYSITTNDANVAAGQTLVVDASGLTASALTFNGAAETDGAFAITGGSANDALTGGAGNDTFDLSHGGNDTAHGGGGNDTIGVGAALTAADTIDGGTGTDTLALNGDYSAGVTLGAATLTSVENLQLAAGHNYKLTTVDANVASGQSLTVDASALGASDVLIFNGSAETNGAFVFKFAGNFSNADQITGGTATTTVFDVIVPTIYNTTLELNGDYSAGLTFATGVSNLGTLQLDAGHSYNLTTADANVPSGKTLYVNASALRASDSLVFNGSAETNGAFLIAGGAGNDTLTGGAGSDFFDVSGGGTDTVSGGNGNDTIYIGGLFNAADTFDGGAGNDILEIASNSAVAGTFAPAMLTNIEEIKILASPGPFTFSTTDADVAAGASLTVDGSSANGPFSFDGSAESDGSFILYGGRGGNVLTGGALADFIVAGTGAQTTQVLSGGGGDDDILVSALATGDTFDGGAGNDTLDIGGNQNATLGANMLTSIETLKLDNGAYTITTNDGNVAAGAILTVDATGLTTGNTLTFHGAAETDGGYDFKFAANYTTSDILTGSTHTVTTVIDPVLTVTTFASILDLNGDYSAGITFSGDTFDEIENIGKIQFEAGHNYKLTFSGGGNNEKLILDGSALGAANSVNLDASLDSTDSFYMVGGAGNDTLHGGGTTTYFDISQGGTDTVTGSAFDDIIYAGAKFSTSDVIDGSNGSDTLVLNGDYSAGLAFTANFTDVENIKLLESGTDYKLSTNNDNNITSLAVDASALTHALIFDGSAEAISPYTIIGGAGNDVITGGAGNDTIDLSHGGDDIVHSSGGTDQIQMGGSLTAADSLGGGSSVTVLLNGDYSAGLTLAATTMVNLETLTFQGSFAAKLIMNDGNLTGTNAMFINGPSTASLNFDGSAESTGHYIVTGGTGADTLIGGHGNDTFDDTRGGADRVQGNGGADTIEGRTNTVDTFIYVAVSDSTSSSYDTIQNVDFAKDIFNVSTVGAVTGVDAMVTGGALSTATFDSDLATDVGSGQLAADHAVEFKANSGTLSGHTFLIIDENGVAGYQAGADLVIQLTTPTGTMTTANFA